MDSRRGRFDCSECEKNEHDGPRQKNCALKKHNHYKKGEFLFKFEWLPPEYDADRCPISTRAQRVTDVIGLYQLCKATSSLPDVGGVNDQDNWTMEAFNLIESEINRIQSERIEEAKRRHGDKNTHHP